MSCGFLALPAQAADWKPVRPINLIVPWAAGGSTDQITRLVAGEMEKSLGQTIVIINQPGASGSIGTRSALEAAKDGYTWTAGAAQDLGAYQTRGKRLRRLATVSGKATELEGYGSIPPLSQTLPGFSAPTNYFGIFIPKGVPDDVIATVEKIWKDSISNSEAVKKYATSRGALFAPSSGEAAQKAVFPAVQANAWLLFDTCKAKLSPDTVGIPKP